MINVERTALPSPNYGRGTPGTTGNASDSGHSHPAPTITHAENVTIESATTAGAYVGTVNYVIVSPVFISGLMPASRLHFRVSTAHASAAYCFGLYTSAGALVLTTGAVQAVETDTGTGLARVAVYDANGVATDPLDIAPGSYFFAHTASSTTGRFYGGGPGVAKQKRYWCYLNGGGGSTLPASINPIGGGGYTVTEDAAARPWFALSAYS